MFVRWMLLKIRNTKNLPSPVLYLIEFGFYLALVSIVFTVAFKMVEKTTWIEALWQVWQTETTIGYGNAPAETVYGRILTMILGLLGMACLGVVISHALDYKQFKADQRRFGMVSNPYTDGYVIFNYPGESLELFIQEIILREPDVGFCIVDAKLTELPPTVLALHNRIHFINGYSHEEDTYKRAAIQKNKCVLIFPADPSSPESDLGTSRLVDLVLRFVGEQTQIIYLLIDPRNEWLFSKKAIPIIQNLELLAAVQECQDVHSSAIVQNILTNSAGTNTQTLTPTRLIGWTWAEFVHASLEASKQLNIPFNALALIHQDTIDASPMPDQVIEEGDKLSVLANNRLIWSQFEGALQKSTSA
jgi:voltage-gated potassium channel